jgi:hypothetical protein
VIPEMCFKKIFCVVAWFFRKSTVFNNEVLLGSKYEDEKKGQLSFSEPLTLYINKLTVLMVDGAGFEPAFVLSNFIYHSFLPSLLL